MFQAIHFKNQVVAEFTDISVIDGAGTAVSARPGFIRQYRRVFETVHQRHFQLVTDIVAVQSGHASGDKSGELEFVGAGANQSVAINVAGQKGAVRPLALSD
jgi:hypothetical protein